MIDEVLAHLAQLKSQESVALASLVESSGSIPMSDRAKMLVDGRGRVIGTIGGGCLEAEIVTVGRDVLDSGSPQMTHYTMTESQAGEHGLNCGGTVAIYTERISADTADREIFAAVCAARALRLATVVVTRLNSGAQAQRWLLREDGQTVGPGLGSDHIEARARQEAASMFGRELARLVDVEEGGRLFLEPFSPPPVLYVFGGGHVGAQICRAASAIGFLVTVVDDRPMFAEATRHPEASDCRVEEMDRVFDRLTVDGQTYIVAATRGHEHDEIIVEQAIRTPACYIGMLGSERKKLILWKRIVERGGDADRLATVSAPIGLNLGADTPEEIAVSVVAELIQSRRGATRRIWKTKEDPMRQTTPL